MVEELLLHCPNNSWVNTPDASGRTPLHAAAAHGQYSVVELLLAKNADLHVLDKASASIPIPPWGNTSPPSIYIVLLSPHFGLATHYRF